MEFSLALFSGSHGPWISPPQWRGEEEGEGEGEREGEGEGEGEEGIEAGAEGVEGEETKETRLRWPTIMRVSS